jgi:hypothetical protein
MRYCLISIVVISTDEIRRCVTRQSDSFDTMFALEHREQRDRHVEHHCLMNATNADSDVVVNVESTCRNWPDFVTMIRNRTHPNHRRTTTRLYQFVSYAMNCSRTSTIANCKASIVRALFCLTLASMSTCSLTTIVRPWAEWSRTRAICRHCQSVEETSLIYGEASDDNINRARSLRRCQPF